MKIALIQVWIGKIPDYFWYHYETTKNIKNVDFIFFTDQNLILDSPNYKVVLIKKEEIEFKLSLVLNHNCFIKNNKKFNDLKSCYGELFKEYLNGYDYYGYYDIDTLMGDLNKWMFPYLPEYDVVSFADEIYHNRICGPLTIIRNDDKINQLYRLKLDRFIDTLESEDVMAYEEQELNQIFFENLKVKLLYKSSNCETHNGGKTTYEAIWSGGKVFVEGKEKMIYHFYRKNQTKFERLGNFISAKYDKKLMDDFLWVTHFSQNYEKLIPSLIESIKKYSNRKCVFYTINYEPDFAFKTQFESDQFIFRRIDMQLGDLDSAGRSSEIMNSKPLILKDAIENFQFENFVHIDTDIYLTVNADTIKKYFDQIENYPLINSHIHDAVCLSNIVPNEQWSDPVPILLKEMEITQQSVYPRRKCNIIVFNKNCGWFFKEQMEIYHKYKDSKPGILALHDEDIANALLTKYSLKKCLPIVDIEGCYDIEMNKYTDLNHPFHSTGISEWVVLPKHSNDVLFFHSFKKPEDYDTIKNVYGNTVMDQEEMVITYKNQTILFEKNSFLSTKKFKEEVNFKITNIDINESFYLTNQRIFNYWFFYISNINLKDGLYLVEIEESDNNRKIFSNILKIVN